MKVQGGRRCEGVTSGEDDDMKVQHLEKMICMNGEDVKVQHMKI